MERTWRAVVATCVVCVMCFGTPACVRLGYSPPPPDARANDARANGADETGADEAGATTDTSSSEGSVPRPADAAVGTDLAADATGPDAAALCPPQLLSIDASPLAPAVTAFNATSMSTRDGLTLEGIYAFAVSCPAESGFAVAVDLARLADQTGHFNYSPGDPPAVPPSHDRATLSQLSVFDPTVAVTLLAAVDAFVAPGQAAPLLEAGEDVELIPCPNCTELLTKTYLFYPAPARLIVIDARRYWD